MTTQTFSHARESLPCPYCAQQHPEDVDSCPNSGQTILLDGKYRLKQLLGEGSFGLVWDARNIDTKKVVAIKSLRAEVVSNPAVLARFLWEATAAGRIHNPHVCDVLDLVKSSAHGPYIVMERLSGQSLEALLQQQGRIAPETAIALVRQALIGLEAVHKAGIVHRDIKPENIFLHEPEGERLLVKVLDFGISKFSGSTGQKGMTAVNLFMGTPEYTSPEQARGAAQVDLRTDIWAIGVVLYKTLAGVSPFDGSDVPSTLAAILHFPHAPLTTVAPHVAAGLAAIVDRCLAKQRELRYASCAELSAALEPFEGLAFARTAFNVRSPIEPDRGTADPPARPRTMLASEAENSGEDPPRAAVAVAGAEHVILGCNAGDRRWLEHLRQHLKTHRDGSRFTTSDCGEFEPGAHERDAIATALTGARAVILLVSPQFLADDFAPGSELFSLAFMAQGRGLPVMWIMIRDCAHEDTELREFQALGDPSRSLDGLAFTEADLALEKICDQIVETLGGPTPAPGGTGSSSEPTIDRSDSTRDIEQRLATARARKAQLEALGLETGMLREEINLLCRSLRMGRPLHHGDVLDDRFVVLDLLGSGGFATVWRALDQTTDTVVALKVLHAQHVHTAERRERFFRGARIMAQLDHPNIVKIIEPWASDGEYEYFAMQFIAGSTLRDMVIGGGLSVATRLQLLISVADALAFAHERGIVHRDVKPSNILVCDDGIPYLTDFDLVRSDDTTGGTGGGLGTVIYAAPEMMERASEADARADVYGLGMTLAFVFYGRDLTMEVIRNTDRLIGELKVSEAIRMVIRTAITWNRDHRFSSGAEFRSALSAASTHRVSLPPTMIATAQPPIHTGTLLAPAPPLLAPSLIEPAPQISAVVPIAIDQPDAHPPSETDMNVSLVKAFAAISKESDTLGDNAVAAVFASLEVHDDAAPNDSRAAHRARLRARSLVPAPSDDQTFLDTTRRHATGTIVSLAVASGILVAIIYLLFVR